MYGYVLCQLVNNDGELQTGKFCGLLIPVNLPFFLTFTRKLTAPRSQCAIQVSMWASFTDFELRGHVSRKKNLRGASGFVTLLSSTDERCPYSAIVLSLYWDDTVVPTFESQFLSLRARLGISAKTIFWEAITASELEPEEIAELPATPDEIASWTCQICWIAYRRPCVWIKQDDFVKTLIRQPSTYMYTLPSHPGLLPTLHQRPHAIQLPPALPEYDYYNLKGELDTNENDAGEQEENKEGEDKFSGVA